MLDKIKNNSILIIPLSFKNEAIKELNNKLLNIKIMSINELIKKLTFDYNEKTIYELMKKFNIKYDIAENYIKNIYYIKNKKYENEKLDKLVEIKEFLETNNLLIYDDLFKEYIKNKTIYLYKTNTTKYEQSVLKNIDNEIIYLKEETKNYTPQIHEFETITEEIEFIAHNICKLIDNKIDINQIKLVNVKNEYKNEIKRIFNFYNIPINFKEKSIYGTKIVQEFIKNYNENIEETINNLKVKYNDNKNNIKIINKIIDIINEFKWCDNYLDIKELVINKLKNINLITEQSNEIEIKALEDIKDEYTFILSFNQGDIPKIYKDEEYIDDITKEKLGIDTSIDKNIKAKELTINQIKNIKNCIITYKLKTPFQSFYPTNIIEELETEIIKNHEYDYITFSEEMDKINLTRKLDKLIKYNIKDNNLEILYSNYNIPYKTYNNAYTKINKENLKKYMNNKLLLSYSSMDTYYHCAFKYYINNILKLDPYEETFPAKIGSLFHYVLEQSLKNNEKYQKYWNEYISKLILTDKEKFFINKLEKICEFTIETINKQMLYTTLNQTKFEEKIYINKDKDIKITFMGIIDKLLYKEEQEETIVAVIDYKTGNTSLDLNKTYYGLNMQLPVYLYLASNTSLKNVKIAGFYLQNIINPDDEEKENNLKLNGYSTSNKDILKKFDTSFENSNIIKGMKTTKEGSFYNYAKTLNAVQIKNLIELVDQKIDEASDNIINANFNINPKQIGYAKDVLIGCEYCKFKDICYRQEKDIEILKEQNYQDFLGGEENA